MIGTIEYREIFRITPTELHWIDSDSAQSDLCAHGNLRVTLNNETLVEVEPGYLSISTGALHLMRTLEADHTLDNPIAEHLIPHCGHYMCLDEQGKLQNIGCPAGLNWWVKHEGKAVTLEFPTGRQCSISAGQWWRAVTDLADIVTRFYDASGTKQFEDWDDEKWFRAFWTEWRRLRSMPDPGA